LQFTLRDRSPSTLEEAQDLAYQIEKNLEFEEHICQVNPSPGNDILDPSDDSITETKLPEVFQVEPMPLKRKWSFSHAHLQGSLPQELPVEIEPPQDKKEEIEDFPPQNFEDKPLKEFPLLIHQVDNAISRSNETTPFYTTLQVNNSLLRNCVLHPNATTNLMTIEIMHRLGLTLPQPNAKGGFTKGIIKDLEVAFDSCPSAPFFIDVVVVDTLNNSGIILQKGLIKCLAGTFQEKGSEVTIPHPEGGFFTLHKEPFVGSPVETPDQLGDQLLYR
jgi:hypothetical protein